jgi:hypothetical protein
MSSTKRGGQRSEADNYPTPAWCVHRLLEEVSLPEGRWLEPGVGDGAIVGAVHEKMQGAEFTGLDIRETDFIRTAQDELGSFHVGDFLNPTGKALKLLNGPKWDVCIGNPPFSLAPEFIDRAFKVANIVAFLLRVNYLGSDKRAEFMRSMCPDLYILPNRPSFVPSERGNLTTDSIEYGWFVWGMPRFRKEGKIKVLATTPKEVRRGLKLLEAAPKEKRHG